MTLTETEYRVATHIGKLRRVTARDGKMVDKAGKDDDFAADILGCAGEIAFAKAAGVYWEPTNKTFSRPDVGQFEIKTVRKKQEGFSPSLPVELETNDEQLVALVYGEYPSFRIIGWISGRDAKKIPAEKKLYRPTHWVPENALRSFDLLPCQWCEKGQALLI